MKLQKAHPIDKGMPIQSSGILYCASTEVLYYDWLLWHKIQLYCIKFDFTGRGQLYEDNDMGMSLLQHSNTHFDAR